MKFNVKTGDVFKEQADLSIVFAVEKAELPEKLSELFLADDFSGKSKQTLLLYTRNAVSPARVLLVGLGESSNVNPDTFRNAAAVAIKEALRLKAAQVTMGVVAETDVDEQALTQAIVEGAVLGSYRFLDYKTDLKEDDTFEVKKVELFSKDAGKAEKGLEEALAVVAGVILARNLVNKPGADITPARLGEEAEALAKRVGIKATVFGMKELKEQGFGGIISIGKASANEPRFIILEYGEPSDNVPTVVLVGKGISFDSGGLSLKPADGMMTMKGDMGGAATVLGTMEAVARLRLPLHLVGLIPSAENMPGPNAVRPGDIVKSLSGKTMEILNTDAEGRVILADAIYYAHRYNPSAIINFATLTGAMIIALGYHATGLMSTDEELTEKIIAAGEQSAERVWELPLWQEYQEMVKSDIADVKNVAGRPAGSITAGAFLAAFAGDFPFAHLDIAATSWLETPIKAYHHKGATGVGVRMMVELLKEYK
ncbi:MAG TPA: leucyl aminopeptidase [Brevefilum sp.]|nr:leucyl aminopeptidase [Brevefilum sp.]HOR19117.1 leucyl aminopeptidase [Brevefilum sp.]HPL68895.1 leucyl aminopeptidase [Brevefilum sp.]